jgi:hypothetical protein
VRLPIVHAERDANCNAHQHADLHTQHDPDGNTHQNADRHAKRDVHGDPYVDADHDGNCDTDADAGAERRFVHGELAVCQRHLQRWRLRTDQDGAGGFRSQSDLHGAGVVPGRLVVRLASGPKA